MFRFTIPTIQATLVVFSLFSSASHAERLLPDFTQLVESNSPAVVNISTTQKLKGHKGIPKGLQIPELPEGSPFNDLFKHFFGEPGDGDGSGRGHEGLQTHSLGSGFIIDQDGYILTNNHVVSDADEILVRLSDRREIRAEVVGADPRSDLALLKIKGNNLPVVKFGRSEQLKVGEWVMAIGSPFGFDHSVSVGIVSALGRSLPRENYVPFIQTDVAINPGNSGGPLFNLDGEVIGINSQIYSRTGGFMGLSFAIPIDMALDVVEQLKGQGYVSRGWLGVLIQDVTRELAESFGMKKPNGALVAEVLKDSPAAKAGIEEGDIITEFNGHRVNYSSDLPPLVGRVKAGSVAKAKILRDGKSRTLTITIGDLPTDEEMVEASAKPNNVKSNRLAITVRDISDDAREKVGITQGGVLVEAIDIGPGQLAGIRLGDVIVKIDGKRIKDARHFDELVRGLVNDKPLPVLIRRHSGPLFLALTLPADE